MTTGTQPAPPTDDGYARALAAAVDRGPLGPALRFLATSPGWAFWAEVEASPTLSVQAMTDPGALLVRLRDPAARAAAQEHARVATVAFEARCELADRFAWALLDDRALDAIAAHAPLLEVGAGRGYWARELAARGVDVVATDPAPALPTWHRVEPLSGLAALASYPGRSLLVMWPNPDFAVDAVGLGRVLEAFTGETLLYVGEPAGGRTGTAAFHAQLAARFNQVERIELPSWWGLDLPFTPGMTVCAALTIHRRRRIT